MSIAYDLDSEHAHRAHDYERMMQGFPVPCLTSGDHEWVNLPALARELDEAFGRHGFHTQAFMHVQNVDECAGCGKRRTA